MLDWAKAGAAMRSTMDVIEISLRMIVILPV
jgi:hypothetical protein